MKHLLISNKQRAAETNWKISGFAGISLQTKVKLLIIKSHLITMLYENIKIITIYQLGSFLFTKNMAIHQIVDGNIF